MNRKNNSNQNEDKENEKLHKGEDVWVGGFLRRLRRVVTSGSRLSASTATSRHVWLPLESAILRPGKTLLGIEMQQTIEKNHTHLECPVTKRVSNSSNRFCPSSNRLCPSSNCCWSAAMRSSNCVIRSSCATRGDVERCIDESLLTSAARPEPEDELWGEPLAGIEHTSAARPEPEDELWGKPLAGIEHTSAARPELEDELWGEPPAGVELEGPLNNVSGI